MKVRWNQLIAIVFCVILALDYAVINGIDLVMVWLLIILIVLFFNLTEEDKEGTDEK